MSAIIRRALVSLACALPLAVLGQTAPAPASSTGMDMSEMPGMAHDAGHAEHPSHHGHGKPKPAKQGMPQRTATPVDQASPMAAPAPADATNHADHASGAMPPMEHGDHAMPDMDHMDMSPHATHEGMDHGGASATHDMRMQGGAAPPDARSADYSDGIGHGDMPGMDMRDAAPLGMLRFDRLEAFDGRDGGGQRWDLQAWYGSDIDRLWVRSEGERAGGRVGDGDAEALWSHAVASYWDTQLGVRHDFGDGPARDWAAFGVQGLAPYWFALSATAYAAPSGRTAARLRVEYELLFTQRLILQPELEFNLYGKADPQRGIGAGLSDASFGLRLRYEIRRQFAPYLGVSWVRRFGATAAYAREDRRPVSDSQLVAGVRIWF
ncbi:copper resistance protein CopB [Rhodanobacter sp. PCA2]|nr:copper resistance protein B [Rhodanobacter sp. PCA2]MBA2078052.1 copper resistance protein CopB [Rhodanobacter sp. PCA2]